MNPDGKLSGPGTIEVAGFSRVFRTRSMAWPDVLFRPLADQVRQALVLADTLTQVDASKREDALLIAERYLSGCLLHDSNYLIAAPGQPQDDTYQIDVKRGILEFRSMMYAGLGQRTSCFKIMVSGNIREGRYEVKSPADGPTMLRFREPALRQPDFFAKILSPLSLVKIIERENAAHPESSSSITQKIKLKLCFSVPGGPVAVVIKNDGANFPWQVLDPVKGQELGVISSELLEDVDQLLESLTEVIDRNAPKPEIRRAAVGDSARTDADKPSRAELLSTRR
jgi:hypothetical protein